MLKSCHVIVSLLNSVFTADGSSSMPRNFTQAGFAMRMTPSGMLTRTMATGDCSKVCSRSIFDVRSAFSAILRSVMSIVYPARYVGLPLM